MTFFSPFLEALWKETDKVILCKIVLQHTSCRLQPARSAGLNPCDFYLWGNLKGKVYANNPQTLDKLKHNYIYQAL
jgi:hypothetical protein